MLNWITTCNIYKCLYYISFQLPRSGGRQTCTKASKVTVDKYLAAVTPIGDSHY